MLEDKIKKVPEGAQEIDEDELDLVAGGAYTVEEWNKMSAQERLLAVSRSLKAKEQNQPCELD